MDTDKSHKWLASGSLLGGISAFIGASCCVLPLILFNIGISSALIARLAFFARYKDQFLLGASALIGLGAFFAFRAGENHQGAYFLCLV